MALDATIAGANANTYILEPAATLLVPNLVSPTVLALWTAATVPVRESSLAKAALMINGVEGRFPGIRTLVDTQALCWPRNAVLTTYRRLVDANTIPSEVVNAQVMYAALDVAGELDITGSDNYSGITSEHAGPVGATYIPANRARGIGRAPSVMILLQPLMFMTSAGAYRL